MNAYKLTSRIPENRKIAVELPVEVPVGPVEIIFVYQTRPKGSDKDAINRLCGSLKGSRFTSEKYFSQKKSDKALEN